jgi:hypothetical protein
VKRFLAALLLPCALGAQGKIAGWYAESKTSTEFSGANAPTTPPRTVREWHAGDRVRTETVNSNIYTVVLDTSRTMYIVSPATKMIRIASATDLTRENVADLESTERKLGQYTDLGPAETILGHKTRKYRVSASWTMKLRLLNDATPRPVKYTRTVWLAADSSDPAMKAALRTLRRAKTSNLPRGIELKSESTTEGIREGGAITTRREMTVLRVEPVNPAMFTLPSGYQRVTVSDELRSRLKQADAMQKTNDELNRLRTSTRPADQARARAMMDSLLKAWKPDSARLKQMMHDDPNAVRINAGATKKP